MAVNPFKSIEVSISELRVLLLREKAIKQYVADPNRVSISELRVLLLRERLDPRSGGA